MLTLSIIELPQALFFKMQKWLMLLNLTNRLFHA